MYNTNEFEPEYVIPYVEKPSNIRVLDIIEEDCLRYLRKQNDYDTICNMTQKEYNLLSKNVNEEYDNLLDYYITKQTDYFTFICLEFKNHKKEICTVTKKYYNLYKDKYNELPLNTTYKKYITLSLDEFIRKYYTGDIGFKGMYTKLLKKNIIPKKNFVSNQIHRRFKPNYNFSNKKILGTYIDCCIRNICDKRSMKGKDYLSTCNLNLNLDFDKTEDELIEILINTEFSKIIKESLNKHFVNVKNGHFCYNHNLGIYGTPDLVTDDTIIDIKVSSTPLSSDNYLQLLRYAIILEKTIICIYEPLNGLIHTMELNNKEYNTLYDFVKKDYIKCIEKNEQS